MHWPRKRKIISENIISIVIMWGMDDQVISRRLCDPNNGRADCVGICTKQDIV